MAVDSGLPSRPLFLAEQPAGPDGRPALRRILIANRGEIACRVIATCRKLNLTSIAVYVDEDASSLHVRRADESIRLGSLEHAARNPFLDAALLVSAALAAGAHAVHPGYGYLSEDAGFARAVRAAGLVFVGPGAAALSTLGNKRAAKAFLAARAPDVPLIPGFAGPGQRAADLAAAAAALGYPVMLKAAAGGGGKGMRVVRGPAELDGALERARSEAARSFGAADCILEKFVEAAKHVEMQVVGDAHGRVVCLGERDCSVQRRHQKVVEEAPCAWLGDGLRARMAAAAVRVARLLAYEGAGTVEFVVDVAAARFYFLEVNARLQVEHPVTEETAGVDLVALQLFVAAGGRLDDLPVLRPVVPRNGHAVECRLCAEDPQRDFLPERGTVRLWRPAAGADTRFETAVESGAAVSIHFDPMVAKIVVWAPTRPAAIAKMVRVLAQTACVGVRTNQLFLQSCLLHPAFRDPGYTTSFVPSNLDSLLQNPYAREPDPLGGLHHVLPCLYLRRLHTTTAHPPFRHVRRGFRNQRHDPVNQHAAVVELDLKHDASAPAQLCILHPAPPTARPNAACSFHLAPLAAPPDARPAKPAATAAAALHNALSAALRTGRAAAGPAHSAAVLACSPCCPGPPDSAWSAATVAAALDGRTVRAHLCAPSEPVDDVAAPRRVLAHLPAMGTWVEYRVWGLLAWAERGRRAEAEAAGEAARTVRAPMPCRVLSVLRRDGEAVRSGEGVMVVESMKMEMSIVVAADGVLRTGRAQGEAVAEGEVLCWVE